MVEKSLLAGIAVAIAAIAIIALVLNPTPPASGTTTQPAAIGTTSTPTDNTQAGTTTASYQNQTAGQNLTGAGNTSNSASSLMLASIPNYPAGASACVPGNAIFPVSPIPVRNITYIEPLGHVNPSGHVFPINHVYLYLPLYANRTAVPATVSSPGNATVFKIERFTYYSSPDFKTPVRTDFTLSFAPCYGVAGFFYHVSGVSAKLLGNFTPPYAYCNNVTAGTEYFQSCGKYVSVKVAAGEELGTAGGQADGSQALDWVLEDFRMKPLEYANDSRFTAVTGQDYSRYIACPLDYFTASARSALYALLGGYPINGDFSVLYKRTTPPLCGTTAQDMAGTAQGNWFAKGLSDSSFNEGPNLALIHDDINTTLGVFSVGTSLEAGGLQPDSYYFTPAASGQADRDFSNVTSDGKVYCYDVKGRVFSSTATPPEATIILQLVTPTQLRMAKIPSAPCGAGPWSFTTGYTDFMR